MISLLLAADPPPLDLDWRSFLTGSVITPVGLVVAFVTGVIAPGWLYKQAVKDRDEARADKEKMTTVMLEELVPLLTRNVDVLKSIDQKLEPASIRLRDQGPS